MKEFKKTAEKMPKWAKYTLYTILGIAGAFLLGLLFGNVIMWLWNWLMPSLFGLRTIGFWEGLGLFLLAKILFGFGGSSHSGDGDKKHHKHKHHHGGEAEKKDWKDWEYYDDWWEEDGKNAFHAYAERVKKEPETKEESKAEEK
jgi:hypothetical protein